MAKKRKQRSSEPEHTKTPDPQQQDEETHTEEEPKNVAVGDSKEVDVEEQQQQDPEEEEEEEGEEEQEEEEDPEDEENEETQDATTNDAVQSEADAAKEENTEEDDEEPLERLLEPFGKDQLITLLKQAVDKHPDLLDSVREIADADPAHRKIFVHGLGWDTTAENLTEEFGKYGEIEDCKAVTDRVSGKSKGYAFILFKHRSGARKALKEPQKKIGNRTTSCQLASAGPVPAPPPTAAPPVSEYTQRKIFVSNVSADLDPDRLLEFFKQYGEIDDGPLGLDKHTGKPKGFALFVYKTVESAKRALEEPHKTFEGHTLHCQKAIDGPKGGKQGYGGGISSGGGGGGHHHQYQQQQHHHHHQPHYKKGKYASSGGPGPGPGHMMAPSGPGMGFNPGVAAAQALNPALGQALTALLTTQGAGLGLGNLLGGLGGAAVNQGGLPAGYGNQAAGGYGGQPGYQNPQMGPSSAGRPQPGGAPYMGI